MYLIFSCASLYRLCGGRKGVKILSCKKEVQRFFERIVPKNYRSKKRVLLLVCGILRKISMYLFGHGNNKRFYSFGLYNVAGKG